MAVAPIARMVADTFRGLITHTDPLALPLGAMVAQDNIGCFVPGRLSVRGGITPLGFSAVGGSADGIAMYCSHHPVGELAIWELTTGTIKYARIGEVATTDLITGWNTYQPMCVAKDRYNRFIFVNGIDRGRVWDGLGVAELLGITAPAVKPGVTSPTGGNATAGDYTLAYRYTDNSIPNPVASNVSPRETHTAAANDKFVYTFTASGESRVTHIEIYRSTAGVNNVLYLVARVGHDGGITSTANDGGTVRFTMSAPHGLIVGAEITVAGNSNGTYNVTHSVTAVSGLTVDTDIAYTGAGTGGTWQLVGYTDDDLSDNDLAASSSISLATVNQSANNPGTPGSGLNKDVPPDHKPYIAFLQDRLFYGGTVEYDVGTVAVINGNTIITGTGTAWTAQMVGRYFTKVGDSRMYLISAASATSITLSEAYAGSTTSGSAYVIQPSPDERNKLYFSETDEPEAVPVTNELIIQENTGDDDEITGLCPHGPCIYVLKDRHVYRLSFVKQPTIDVSITLAFSRGCVNNRCWAKAEDYVYVIDQTGLYRFRGENQPEPIGLLLQSYFRESLLDWANAKWWFVQDYPGEEVIRFHVSFVGDGSTRPKRALCFNYRTSVWWTESYTDEFGGGGKTIISGKLRTILAGENDRVMVTASGLADGIATALTGSVVAAGANTLTVANGTGTDTAIGASVTIQSGTGKHQPTRRIISRAADVYTLDANWTTPPDTSSTFLIGGIAWIFKTGRYAMAGAYEGQADRLNSRAIRFNYVPTSNAGTLDVRRYLNYQATPNNSEITWNQEEGVTATDDATDIVCQLGVTFNEQYASAGNHLVPFDGLQTDGIGHDKFLAVEFRGQQGLDEIHISGLTLEGVRPA